jgi:hypothetical protein
MKQKQKVEKVNKITLSLMTAAYPDVKWSIIFNAEREPRLVGKRAADVGNLYEEMVDGIRYRSVTKELDSKGETAYTFAPELQQIAISGANNEILKTALAERAGVICMVKDLIQISKDNAFYKNATWGFHKGIPTLQIPCMESSPLFTMLCGLDQTAKRVFDPKHNLLDCEKFPIYNFKFEAGKPWRDISKVIEMVKFVALSNMVCKNGFALALKIPEDCLVKSAFYSTVSPPTNEAFGNVYKTVKQPVEENCNRIERKTTKIAISNAVIEILSKKPASAVEALQQNNNVVSR